MATPATVPIFAPDGSTGEVPSDRVADALKAGGKLALRVTAPDGSTGLVPHDQLGKAVAAGARPSGVGQRPAPPSDAALAADVPVWQRALATAKGVGSYLGNQLQQVPQSEGFDPSRPMGQQVQSAMSPDSPQGKRFITASQMAIPAGAAVDALPSAARAAGNFRDAAAVANKVPISLNPALQSAATDIADMAKAGGQMPKVVRNFLQRVTDPTQGPVTYEEARKFYQNATRLSSNEYSSLTPNMQRMVGNFTSRLGSAIQDAADSVGVGDLHSSAMKEYANLSTLRRLGGNVSDAVVPGLVKGLVGGGAAYGLYNLLKR